MRDNKTVKKAKRIGGSVILSLTGFVQADNFYKIECAGKQVILTKIDI